VFAMRIRSWLAFALLGAVVIAGCSDRAEPALSKCIQLQLADDLRGAWGACNDAIKADPNSVSGKSAAAKLSEMKPKYDALMAKAEERRKKKAAAEAKAEADAKERRLAMLRAKVKKTPWAHEPDRDCQGKGLPEYKWEYKGGTYEEDREAAFADDCKALYYSIEHPTYCCPQRPSAYDDTVYGSGRGF
jgi:hypothetical protein